MASVDELTHYMEATARYREALERIRNLTANDSMATAKQIAKEALQGGTT